MTERVAFWILSGERYIEEARQSAATLRAHMPNLARILYTPDSGVRCGGEFDEVRALPARQHDIWYLDSTHYFAWVLDDNEQDAHLLWLDSDTYTVAPFNDLFELLDRFDLAGAHAPGRVTTNTVRPIPASFPEINIGVLAMRNNAAMHYFARMWYRYYSTSPNVYGNNDQGSFRESLWRFVDDVTLLDNFNFYVVPPEFNCRLFGAFLKGRVRILHGRHPDMPRLAQECNAELGMRLWQPK